MILKILNHLNSEIQIMARMRVNQFAHELSFVRAFFYDLAIVLEEVVNKELIEFL